MVLAVTRNKLGTDVLCLTLLPLCFPCGKLPLAFLAVIVGEDVWQDAPRDLLDLILRDAGVVDELLCPKGTPPFLREIKMQTRFTHRERMVSAK